MFLEDQFFEHSCTMASVSSIEKDSIVTSQDSFKNFTLSFKILNQIHTIFKKKKVPEAASAGFAEKTLFCVTYVLYDIFPLSVAKIFERYFRSSSFLVF